MDLLVMENLFYKHEISKTYDLKGIGKLTNPPECTQLTLVRGAQSRKV
jgi:hypothetical protein